MKRLSRLFLILSVSLLVMSCNDSNEYFRLSGYTMGTTYQITFQKGTIDPQQLKQSIDNRLDEINQLMSTYIDDSELSVFNQTQSTECLPLSHDTLYVIQNAVKVFHQTRGKFDVTLAPLIEVWGFDKKNTDDQIPTQAVIEQYLAQIGSDKFTINEGCIVKQRPHLSINLSAIAKGYGVDEIAKLVDQFGAQNYLVEIGGEVANKGVNPKGKPWRIAIESASTEARSIQRTLTPKGLGLATSGSYRNYFEKDGQRFSHTIDPTTGYPITHNLASVTVLHQETMLADAIATAMMVMGPDESLRFANQKNLAIFMLVKSGDGFKEVYSDAFKAYLN